MIIHITLQLGAKFPDQLILTIKYKQACIFLAQYISTRKYQAYFYTSQI